jgi:hypothetical protein
MPEKTVVGKTGAAPGVPGDKTARNREAWLTELAARAEVFFRGFDLGRYRLTCGWPSRGGLAKKARRVGECYAPECSRDGTHEIFVSPVLDDPQEVAGTVCHEMAHVAAGIPAGHGPVYKKVCRHVGLVGRPTNAMPGELLRERLAKIIDRVGPYPHSALTGVLKVKKPPTSFTLACGACGCLVRISSRWLTTAGFPVCGCGESMALRDGGGE